MAASKKGPAPGAKKTRGVKLSDEFHKELKLAAIERDTTMEALVEEAVRALLGKRRA